MKEVQAICNNPPEGIQVIFSEDNITDIQADIDGPVQTPFEGGLFRVKLVLGQDFPSQPPKAFFLTKIFHPNVSKSGEICVNTLKKDWKPEHGIQHILLVIRCLLIEPNPASALNEDAGIVPSLCSGRVFCFARVMTGKLLLENYDEFAKRAAMMTRIHAKAKKRGGADDSKCKMEDEKEEKKSRLPLSSEASSSSNSAPSSSPVKPKKAAVATGTGGAPVDKRKAAAKKGLKRL